MTKKRKIYPLIYRPKHWWLLTNCGIPWGAYTTRLKATKKAEDATGLTWTDIDYFDVRRVRLVEVKS